MLDWNDLRYVLETTRRGGISGAARVLGVNHATVARRVTAIEKALGARLFDRLASGYVPTEAGWEAVAAAEAMEETGAKLDRQIGARDTDVSGRLTITAPQLLIERVLAPILTDYIDAFPAVSLHILAPNELVNLAQREADVAIRISSAPPQTLIGQRVANLQAAVYASPTLIARDKGGAAPLDWIRFTHWPGPHEAVSEVRPNLRVRLSVDDMVAGLTAARAGIGATRMACFLGETDPGLTRLPGVPTFPYAPLWVLTHVDLREVPRIRSFVDFAVARLRALRPLFEGRAET